jgi:hypothetical protein
LSCQRLQRAAVQCYQRLDEGGHADVPGRAAAGACGWPPQAARRPQVRSASCIQPGGNNGYCYGVWAGECAGSWSPQRWRAADCQGRPGRAGWR